MKVRNERVERRDRRGKEKQGEGQCIPAADMKKRGKSKNEREKKIYTEREWNRGREKEREGESYVYLY